jgi:hypothetical protein
MGVVGAPPEGKAGEDAGVKCSCGAIATTRCPGVLSWESTACCAGCLQSRQRATTTRLHALFVTCVAGSLTIDVIDESWWTLAATIASIVVVSLVVVLGRRVRPDLLGRRSVSTVRGFVADRCTECNAVRAFKLLDHYLLHGLLPRFATYERSSRACTTCRTEHSFDESAYDGTLEWKELDGVSMERGIRTTNRRLAELLKVVDRLRALHDGPAYRSSPTDRDALSEATTRFERLVYETADLEPIATRLDRWRELTPDERNQIITELRELGASPRFRVESPPNLENATYSAEPEAEAEPARATALVR